MPTRYRVGGEAKSARGGGQLHPCLRQAMSQGKSDDLSLSIKTNKPVISLHIEPNRAGENEKLTSNISDFYRRQVSK